MSLFQKCLIQGGTSASQTTVLFCSTKQWTFPKGLRSLRTHQHPRLPPIPSSFFHSRVNQPHQGFCFIVYTLTWQLIDAPFFSEELWSGFTVEDTNSRDLWWKTALSAQQRRSSQESDSHPGLDKCWYFGDRALACNCETWSVMCLHVL